ncbi:hypothetical protein CLOP_g10094 [Closterium sp. NIES-67]|nr:hypothetical protein CLOP_g10094 [Closterium sp. NIES-67]
MLCATHEDYTKIVPAVAAAAKQFKGELVFVYINGSDTESQPAFAKSFIDGDLKPFHKSEPIPEKSRSRGSQRFSSTQPTRSPTQ